MLVRDVDGVKYDELGEIIMPDGEIRRCRVLEVNGSDVLVQLFEASADSTLNIQRCVSRVTAFSCRSPARCWAASSTAWASPSTTARS